MTQREAVLNHLQRYGTISPVEGQVVYGIQRLASRIEELRKMGVAIITQMKKDARGHRYSNYILAP